ncbi:signal transduction histidine kinase [Alkalibaculum bacchi]|uniref:histidine kinase n=1 Tax=Alkalibaculum bacchi TaxID=645887 RepID=A0A366HWV8_9FIRM|nr:HAMP domain-containing sensor histidine kinase [Alkalibaculum bacchi]RBP57545.1 signal transduction histidine kinase [Alkalibaculum bacchi]
MDWINHFTKDWKLKKSFSLYMIVFLIIGLVLGLVTKAVLECVKFDHLSTSVFNQPSTSIFSTIILSKAFTFLIDFIVPILIVIFPIIGFIVFYKHKIQQPIHILNDMNCYEEWEGNNQDELALASNRVIESLQEFENMQLAYTFQMNNATRKTDTLLHEIKNPLSTLKGDIELLDIVLNDKNHTIQEIIQRMKRNEGRIETYLSKLTEKGNIKKIEADLNQISILALWKDLYSRFVDNPIPIAFEKNISDNHKNIKIDESLFYEAISNIIDNANRFAKRKIVVQLFETENEYVLTINDDGKGFSKDALKNYDQPYFSESTLSGNMGLGLFITRALLNKQEIAMEAKNNHGACLELFIKKS